MTQVAIKQNHPLTFCKYRCMYTLIFSFVTICGRVHHYLNNWIRHLFDCLPQRVLYHYCESTNTSLPYVCISASRTSRVVFMLSISCKTQPHLGLHKDPRCAARSEFYETQPLSSSIREMGGWFGTLVLKYICVTRGKEIAQDCTLSLSFALSFSHTHR